MPRNGRFDFYGDSSIVSLLSGWVQQGVENFFATQRILVDLAMTQNANAMKMFRSRFDDPAFRPAEVATDLAEQVASNFIEGQKLLLGLVQRENEIVTNGVRERVAGNNVAIAMTDLVQRGFSTFVEMQQDLLKITSKQTHNWLNALKTGRGFDGAPVVELAQEAMETFVQTQKKFLDLIAEESANATTDKEPARKTKKTELSALAKEATEAFIDAQKKLIDVAGKQVNAHIEAADRTMNMLAPLPFNPITDLTRQGVKDFVSAEKALIDTVVHHPGKKVTVTATSRTKPAPRVKTRKRARRKIKVTATTV